MIKFYYHPAPNPAKVALFLEESGLPYEVVPVDTRKGEQFAPDFVAINPNSKTPVITDGDVGVFDSTAILLYLAEKTGGAVYTIVDMSAWGWVRAVPFILGDDAWSTLPHLKRWLDLVNARPAAVRAGALKERYTFKTEMDTEARRHLFRHAAAP